MPNKSKRSKKSRVSIVHENCITKNVLERKEQNEKNQLDEADGQDGENICLLGHYITKEYELLRLVLSYLPLRDLYAASQVCKTWQSAVEVIKRSRHPRPHWLFWDSRQKDIKREELPYFMFSRHFFSEPQLCLMFMTRALNRTGINCRSAKAPCPCDREGKRCNMVHHVLHYMRAELQNCPCVMVEGYGVVGSSYDLTFTKEVENFNAYSALLLPKVPNMSVKVFHLTQNDCLSLKTIKRKDIESLTKLSPTTEPIRCLLLYCKCQFSRTVEKLVATLQDMQESKFAVGGGFYDNINLGSLAPMNEKRHVAIVGIAFSGEGIQAASTVLGNDVGSEQHVSEAMEELRSCQLPGQDSVAFMFACVGRGRDWYSADHVESTSFRHHFPSTPLVGYFGAGEIGRKFLPGNEKTCLERQVGRRLVDDDKEIIRSYTSVFVYLSFSRLGAA